MGTYFQVALGVLPIALFLLALFVFSKKKMIRNIMIAVASVALAGALATPIVIHLFFSDTNDAATVSRINLVYAIALNDSPELANDLLSDMRVNYQPEFALAGARLAANAGNYQTAEALYLKSLRYFQHAEEEYNTILDLFNAESDYDDAIMNGDDSQVAAALQRWDALSDEIARTLPSILDDALHRANRTLYIAAARHIIDAEHSYMSYLQEGYLDDDETRRQLRRINAFLQENPAFAAIPMMRISRLKLQILTEDFRGIAANVNEHSDHNELLIVSELFINNLVRQSDFTGGFSLGSAARYEIVTNRLNDILTNHFQDKPRDERNAARMQIQALRSVIRNPALGRILEELSIYAESGFSVDASKVFMQMAKIEHSIGNEFKVSEYLSRSFDTVGDCEDIEFVIPMYELISIITDKDDAERLHNVAMYVERVLENSMTIRMPSISEFLSAENAAGDADETFIGEFSLQMQTHVNQRRMAVNIVNVDTTQFERDNTIRVTVNISNDLHTSAEALRDALSIRDCGIRITDFTVEKVNYTRANILLCIDVSGSMAGNDKIGMLSEAVKLFAEDIQDIENISIVTFDSSVVAHHPFGLSSEEVISIAESLRPLGGTNMYGALIESISHFTNTPGEINAIILMTDGMDNSPRSPEDIRQNIGVPARESGITIYSIAFGNDADLTYANHFSQVTGGPPALFAIEPDANTQLNQLGAFFDSIRAQILNQYIITFRAVDTISQSRELVISVDSELNSDRVRYRLGGGADSITDPDDETDSPVFLSGRTVHGLQPRQLFKNGRTLSTVLTGEGFAAEDNISIAIRGTFLNLAIPLSSSFVDGNNIAVTIPADVGADEYDVIVTINGKTTTLRRGLFIFIQGTGNWHTDAEESPLAALEPFSSADEAALAWANYIYSSSLFVRHEHGAIIYRSRPGEYRLSATVGGNPHSISINPRIPFSARRIAYHHTHPNGNQFSDGDKGYARSRNTGIYFAGPVVFQQYDALQLRLFTPSRRLPRRDESDTQVSANVMLRPLDETRAELIPLYEGTWDSHFTLTGGRRTCPNGFGCHRMTWPFDPWPPD